MKTRAKNYILRQYLVSALWIGEESNILVTDTFCVLTSVVETRPSVSTLQWLAVQYTAFEMWWNTRKNQISAFGEKGGVHLNRRRRQFRRLLAAELCALAVVMLDTPFTEVVWRYWLLTPFASFPFTSPPVRQLVPPQIKWTTIVRDFFVARPFVGQGKSTECLKTYRNADINFSQNILFLISTSLKNNSATHNL